MGGASTDINVSDNANGACSLESIVDGLLFEAYEEFKSEGQKHHFPDASVLSEGSY